MHIRLLESPEDLRAYDHWVRSHPHGNLWQSLERRDYCESRGRKTFLYVLEEGNRFTATAQVVSDQSSAGFAAWEIPKGPLWSAQEPHAALALLSRIIDDAKNAGAMVLYYSPSPPLPCSPKNAHRSNRHIYAEATRIIDLSPSEEMILAQMHQKGRYNIRRAEKHGVHIKKSDDVSAFYALLEQTGDRDAFGIHPHTHYEQFLTSLKESFLMIAYHGTKPIAGLMGVIWQETGIYYYGASSHADRALMAPYLLQWEAMKYCKSQRCTQYDLLGIAPPDAHRDHAWRGITEFKAKFGGSVITYPPEQQIILRRGPYYALRIKRNLMG